MRIGLAMVRADSRGETPLLKPNMSLSQDPFTTGDIVSSAKSI